MYTLKSSNHKRCLFLRQFSAFKISVFQYASIFLQKRPHQLNFGSRIQAIHEKKAFDIAVAQTGSSIKEALDSLRVDIEVYTERICVSEDVGRLLVLVYGLFMKMLLHLPFVPQA
ncbi:hypothetical protein J3Q64DRAFT_1702729 [Phycomyces blakesleeanus]|uniref:Uncharacterized protein n=1 Tax=Phycomyces blakesleeanus TaxID=4837 RepID=A0ABR3ANZ5_PHYBL